VLHDKADKEWTADVVDVSDDVPGTQFGRSTRYVVLDNIHN
jgi:hypothetical protein